MYEIYPLPSIHLEALLRIIRNQDIMLRKGEILGVVGELTAVNRLWLIL